MIAEKAALLGRDDDAAATDDRSPRLTSDNPISPSVSTDERASALSITSPGEGNTVDPLASSVNGMSEKARGKMRAVDPAAPANGDDGEMVDIPDEELMQVAAAGVGPNNYVPTQEWVSSWQKGSALHIAPMGAYKLTCDRVGSHSTRSSSRSRNYYPKCRIRRDPRARPRRKSSTC